VGQEKWTLKMCLLYISHKRRGRAGRHDSLRRLSIYCMRQYNIWYISDDKKAHYTDQKIPNISLAEIQLRDEDKKIEIEKPDKKQIQYQFMVRI
jgi:hypothetical protein